MARWDPHAGERLGRAALALFAERGYDTTTVNDIAERAGLTKSTFFRHCTDKRGVLFVGQHDMATRLTTAVHSLAPGTPPGGCIALMLDVVGAFFPPEHRPTAATRAMVIAAHPELRERELLKRAELAAAVEDALHEQGLGEIAARFVATVGVLALDITYHQWATDPEQRTYRDHAAETLHELSAQAAELGNPLGACPAEP